MKDLILPIVLAFIAGNGVAVAIIGLLKDKLDFSRKRKAQKEDKEQTNLAEWRNSVDEKLTAQGEGIKFLLYDRIQHLGQEYIVRQEITFEDKKNLHTAHSVYHNGLKGNGDLDQLMSDVDKIPLTIKR